MTAVAANLRALAFDLACRGLIFIGMNLVVPSVALGCPLTPDGATYQEGASSRSSPTVSSGSTPARGLCQSKVTVLSAALEVKVNSFPLPAFQKPFSHTTL